MFAIIQALCRANCQDPFTIARRLAPIIAKGVSIEDAIKQHRAQRPSAYFTRKDISNVVSPSS